MSIRRTAALAVSAAILVGGGATALAATAGTEDRPVVEAAAIDQLTGASIGSDIDASAESSDPAGTGDGTEAEASAEAPGNTAGASSTDPAAADGDSAESDDSPSELAGLPADADPRFGTMSTVPPDWSRPEWSDSGYITDDGPSFPFDIRNLDLASLTSLARSVGIEVGTPVFADDGSMTIAVTLPDGTEHTVWVGFDEQGRFSDATVDGTPIVEFVQRFLAGDFDTSDDTVLTIPPEWNLPD